MEQELRRRASWEPVEADFDLVGGEEGKGKLARIGLGFDVDVGEQEHAGEGEVAGADGDFSAHDLGEEDFGEAGDACGTGDVPAAG